MNTIASAFFGAFFGAIASYIVSVISEKKKTVKEFADNIVIVQQNLICIKIDLQIDYDFMSEAIKKNDAAEFLSRIRRTDIYINLELPAIKHEIRRSIGNYENFTRMLMNLKMGYDTHYHQKQARKDMLKEEFKDAIAKNDKEMQQRIITGMATTVKSQLDTIKKMIAVCNELKNQINIYLEKLGFEPFFLK